MVGADREKPLRAGYIGDWHSGGLVLHDAEQDVTIELGNGIDGERAQELACKLNVVLAEIHNAQPQRPTWVVHVPTGDHVRLEGLLHFDWVVVRLANGSTKTVGREDIRRVDTGERI